MAGGVESVYTALKFKGYYLPLLKSSCITTEYLKGVLFKQFFSLLIKET